MRVIDLFAIAALLWLATGLVVLETRLGPDRPSCTKGSVTALFTGCRVSI